MFDGFEAGGMASGSMSGRSIQERRRRAPMPVTVESRAAMSVVGPVELGLFGEDGGEQFEVADGDGIEDQGVGAARSNGCV